MGKRKAILLLFAIAATYFVAAGGVMPLLADGSSGYLLTPIETATPFDMALGVSAILALVWVALLDTRGTRITRTQLVSGIAVGCGSMALVFTLVNVLQPTTRLYSELPAIVAIMAVLYAFAGTAAALLLLTREESRRTSPVPLTINGFALLVTLGLFFMPLFQ